MKRRVGTAWRIKPLLVALGALIVAVAVGHRLGAAAAVALVVAAAVSVYRLRPLARPSYAASDHGRVFVVEADRTLVVPLPRRIDVIAPVLGARGAIDLGTLDVTVEPGHHTQRAPLRLSGVTDPAGSARLLRQLADGR